ncbi:MAG: hypothetical protein O7I42_07780 [Alphaproteobacteria bacterium]|nr:hypothetical protein [Alphaproteobacteria bacterium]
MKIGFKRVSVLLAATFFLAAGAAASAEKEVAPYLKITIPIEVQNNGNFASDVPGNRLNDLFTTIEPEITVGILKGLTFITHVVLDPVRDASPGDSRFFSNHGLYIEESYLQYKAYLRKSEGSAFAIRIYGGKITPNFGSAWDVAPGIFGTDFAEDYELTERIGFGGAVTWESGAFGNHTLSASTFVLDRTILSEALITRRPRTLLADGGPSNTKGLRSFAVALDGENIPGLKGLAYHIAFVKQGMRGAPAERGFAVGLTHSFEAGNVTIKPIFEIVNFWNTGGATDTDTLYLTSGVSVERGGWHTSLSGTLRSTSMAGAGKVRDTLIQVSGGYKFHNGFGIELGYSHRNETSIATHTIGVLLTYELSFDSSKR